MTLEVYDAWPRRVVVGAGSAGQVVGEVQALGCSRLLIVSDRGVVGTAAVGDLLALLRAEVEVVGVFAEVESNPTDRGVDQLVAFMREAQPDGLLAVGGGSPIDAAKCANLLLTHGGRAMDYVRGGPRSVEPGRLLPLVAVPTTAGTASEVTSVSVITDSARGRKVSLSSPLLVPDASILDPLMTLSLPPHLTAYTGMDALTHLVEAYVSTAGFAPAEGVALAGVGIVQRALPRAVAQGDDVQVRTDMLMASMMGGVAFNHNRLGLVHAMAHQLSTACGLHHGLANGILLPRVMAFNLSADPLKFAHIAQALGVETAGVPIAVAALRGVKAVERLSREIGIPRSLAEVGVTREHIPAMVEMALVDTALRRNPRPATAADVEDLYLSALEGRGVGA